MLFWNFSKTLFHVNKLEVIYECPARPRNNTLLDVEDDDEDTMTVTHTAPGPWHMYTAQDASWIVEQF